MYAKFKSTSEIDPAPNMCIREEARVIGYNLDSNDAMLRADGYLPVIKANQPGPYYDKKYVLQADVIYEAWTPKDLESVRSIRIGELCSAASEAVAPFTAAFSTAEIMTWDRQDEGATALSESPTANTNGAELVRAIAQYSETPLSDTIEDIKRATATPNTTAGYIVGTQKKIYKQLTEAKTLEELLAININIELPK